MKKLFKPFAVLALAAALAFSASGCGEDTSWSYKASGNTLSNGNWIYYTYTEYQNAKSKIDEQKAETSESDESSAEIDYTKEKIDNKKAVDWIYAEAKDACIAQLTMEKLVKDNKVKIDEEALSNMESSYKMYYENFKDTLEELGVSEETYVKANARYGYLSQQLFMRLYDKGGSKEVKDEELNKYFTEKYTHYFYIPYALQTTDESGNSTDVSEEDVEKMTTNFNKYALMLNKEGKTTDDVVARYKTDNSTETDPSTSQTTILENAGLDEELENAIKELKAKQAVVKKTDSTLYLIYKADINDYVANIKSDSEFNSEDTSQISRTTILYGMKSEEFENYLKAEKKKLKYEKNDACISKYNVQRTIDIITKAEKEASSAS